MHNCPVTKIIGMVLITAVETAKSGTRYLIGNMHPDISDLKTVLKGHFQVKRHLGQ